MKTPTANRIKVTPSTRAEMKGFSLIEMMISIAIGLMIIAALVGVLTSSSSGTKSNDRNAELQSNGRYAIDHLKRELRQAGYRGYTPQAPQSINFVTPVINGECGTAGSFVKNIRQSVWGSNGNNPFGANCIPDASYLQGDVLVIRHADDTPTLLANAVASTLYLRSSYAAVNILPGAALAGLPATICPNNCPEIFEVHEYVYYISPFTNSTATTGIATESPQIPALYRVALQADGTMLRELVVSGIEHLQVEYGMTNADGTSQYFTANNITGDHSATGATDWDKISSVRIWLIARNSKAETGYNNTSTYNLSNLVYGPMNDSFRRQVFTTVVQLRNFRN